VSEEGLANTMGEQSFADFERYWHDNWDFKKSIKVRLVKALRFFVNGNLRVSKVVAKMGHRLKLDFSQVPVLFPRKLRILTYGYLGKESLLFHWGVEKLIATIRRRNRRQSVQGCGGLGYGEFSSHCFRQF